MTERNELADAARRNLLIARYKQQGGTWIVGLPRTVYVVRTVSRSPSPSEPTPPLPSPSGGDPA